MKAMWMIFVFGLAAVASAVAEKPISFAKLPVGDTLEVAFTSDGCFHGVAYAFTFERGKKMTVKISRDEFQPPMKKKKTGEITISGWDLAGLDRLMKYYRSDNPGGCTTIDTITLVQKRGGKVVAEEKYTDATCGTYGKFGIQRFPSLAKRAIPDKP